MLRAVRTQLWTPGLEPNVFNKPSKEKIQRCRYRTDKGCAQPWFRGNHDGMILVAGDGDYVPLAEEVKRLGKLVMVQFF